MLARGADLATLDDTETLVKHAARDGIVALMRFIRHDFDNRPPEDLLRRHDAKLNAYNRHCILISLSRNIFGDPFLPNISGLLNKMEVSIKRGPTKGGFVLSPLGQTMLAKEPSKGVILFYIVSHAKVELLTDGSLYGFIYKATLNDGTPSPVYKHDFTTCACKDPDNASCDPKSMKAPPNVLARPCFQEVRHFIFKISFLSKESVTFSIYNRKGEQARKRTDTTDGFRGESHIQYDLYDSKFLAGEPIIPPVLFREPLLRPLETTEGIGWVKLFPGLDAHVSTAVKA